MIGKNTFPKKEHLCGEALVEQLYEDGDSLFVYPFRAVYRNVPLTEADVAEDVYVRCLFSAPKRKFKHAVDRNRLKRQMREAYRKNKHALVALCAGNDEQMHLAVQYVGQKLEPTSFLEKKMIVLLSKLCSLNLKHREEERGGTQRK